MNLQGPSLRLSAPVTPLLLKNCGSGGKSLATPCPIWSARDLNHRLPVSEANALFTARPIGCQISVFFNCPTKDKINQIKSFIRYSLYYAKVYNEFVESISVSLHPSSTDPFEELLQRCQAVGNTVSNLTGLRFEPHTYTAWETNAYYSSTTWPVPIRKTIFWN